MFSKKSIIQYLKEQGFEKQVSISDCLESVNRSYFIQVTSRSKQGWKHIFCNPRTKERLELEIYMMYLKTDESSYLVKLNKNNEELINLLISNFLRL